MQGENNRLEVGTVKICEQGKRYIAYVNEKRLQHGVRVVYGGKSKTGSV